MKYILLLLMIVTLQAKQAKKASNDVCDSTCRDNKATAALNKKPFVSTALVATAASGPAADTPPASQNNIKTLELLQKLQSVLKEKKDETLPEFAPSRSLRPSDKDTNNIPALRQILQSLGYLEKATDSPFFDAELEKAIKAFQVGHCLKADGIIGDETKARINWTYEKRLTMVNSSISELQKLVFTDRTVVVNVPTYTMYAYENQKLVMRMKAVVGNRGRPTPLMTSYINGLEFNPAWVVPETILSQDHLPKIQNDPNFFETSNIEVQDHDGNDIDPSTVDWSEVDVHDFPYVFKQKPGKKNALGLVKFNLQNNEAVYMHDTSQPKAFREASRALSSGCIRLEKAGKFACWLLDLDKDAVKEIIDTGETEARPLEKLIAVHIVYSPVWIEEQQEKNKVLWGDDPYKQEPSPFY
jgi:murein L,D-transpeptidase YcbB/YkuD